jgi:hypothetical protein
MLYLLLLLQPPSDRIAEAPPAAKIEAAEPAHNYRWVRGNNPDQIHLMDGPAAPDGVQVGTWVYSERKFHWYHADHDSWGYPEPMPQGLPNLPAKPKGVETHPLPEMPKPQSFAPVRRGRSC